MFRKVKLDRLEDIFYGNSIGLAFYPTGIGLSVLFGEVLRGDLCNTKDSFSVFAPFHCLCSVCFILKERLIIFRRRVRPNQLTLCCGILALNRNSFSSGLSLALILYLFFHYHFVPLSPNPFQMKAGINNVRLLNSVI